MKLGRSSADVGRNIAEMEELHDIAEIFQSHPRYAGPDALRSAVRDLLDNGRHSLFADG